jgi:hypothetical protein
MHCMGIGTARRKDTGKDKDRGGGTSMDKRQHRGTGLLTPRRNPPPPRAG